MLAQPAQPAQLVLHVSYRHACARKAQEPEISSILAPCRAKSRAKGTVETDQKRVSAETVDSRYNVMYEKVPVVFEATGAWGKSAQDWFRMVMVKWFRIRLHVFVSGYQDISYGIRKSSPLRTVLKKFQLGLL